jgi:hypothetical protein
MTRMLRNAALTALTAALTFGAGVVSAQGTGSCPEPDTTFCIYTDVTIEDTCCLDPDGQGLRSWTCSREVFDCIEGDMSTSSVLGAPFNCHSPGGACGL